MDNTPRKARGIFLAAIKLPVDQREAFLSNACKGNRNLHQRISALLQAQAEIGSFFEMSARTVDQPISETDGTVIGPYKLIEKVGDGGMGTVWMAQQSEPVKRLVALKLIKPGMDSRQVIARFEAERQALALMDHPNIARVLDGGTTSAGRPYFVMDLVRGVPITRYCDEHHLTPRQRLELFIPICQAIQHAHQKGIIHRDLKPSNVLVALYDGKPVPKVIDFGVAKATGQPLTEQTLVTGFGNIVGTLEYMSPEQAEINQLDIDTRSDVYSLGVLLYELLTGSPPFSRKELEKAGMLEMLRVIREQEPSKPSTKLSTAEGLPTLAANRGTEPAKLTKLVRGELDWIVMKALEKDRNRRYETANGFAMDVQRYLADEPVQACPPSTGYRLRKFARRNKARLAVAGLVLFFLILLGGGGGWIVRDREARRAETAQQLRETLIRVRQWVRDNKLAFAREELTTASGRMRADRAAFGALAEDIEALDAELGRYQRFLEFVERAHEAEFPQTAAWPLKPDAEGARAIAPAQATSPVREAGKAASFLLTALSCYRIIEDDDWTARLERDAIGPTQVAVVRRTAYDELLWLADDVADRGINHGSGQKMSPHESAEAGLAYLRRAAAAHPRTTAFYLIRASLLKREGKHAEAAQDEILARRTPATIALDHYLLASAAYGKRDKVTAVREYEAALRVEPTHYWSLLGLAWVLNNLSQDDADFALAAAAFTGCILSRPDHAYAYWGRGQAYGRLSRYDEAEADCRQAIRLRPDFPEAHNQLGYVLWRQERHAEAEAACREAIRLNPGHVYAYTVLGLIFQYSHGKTAETARFFADAFAAQPNVASDLNADNRSRAACAAALAGCGEGSDAAELDEAERARLRRQALDWLTADLASWGRVLRTGPADDRPYAHRNLRNWQQTASLEGVRGDGLAALPVTEREDWQQFWEDVERTLSAPRLEWDDPRTWLDYARSLDQSGKHDEARQFRTEARTICQKDPALAQNNSDYALAYANLLLKDGVPPGTVLSLPWQSTELHIRYPERRATIPPNPILYLTFDEDTVHTLGELMFAADLSGNGFHGTGQGVSYCPTGKVGGCLAFSGGKLRMPGSLMNRLSEYTFTAWMFAESTGGPEYQEYLYLKDTVYGLRYDLFVNAWNWSRKPDYWRGGRPAGLIVPRGQWYFVAARLRDGGVDSGTVEVFMNGNRYEIPGQRMEGSSAIGVFTGAAGKLDEVAIYDRALSDDEVRTLAEQVTDVPASQRSSLGVK